MEIFRLPVDVDIGAIHGSYDRGLVVIRLPRLKSGAAGPAHPPTATAGSSMPQEGSHVLLEPVFPSQSTSSPRRALFRQVSGRPTMMTRDPTLFGQFNPTPHPENQPTASACRACAHDSSSADGDSSSSDVDEAEYIAAQLTAAHAAQARAAAGPVLGPQPHMRTYTQPQPKPKPKSQPQAAHAGPCTVLFVDPATGGVMEVPAADLQRVLQRQHKARSAALAHDSGFMW